MGRYLICSFLLTFVAAIGAESLVSGKSGSGAMRSTSGTAGCSASGSALPLQPIARRYASPNARWKLKREHFVTRGISQALKHAAPNSHCAQLSFPHVAASTRSPATTSACRKPGHSAM